ncbi:unnamed protein product [Leuciscus chuanchicus]
MPLFSPCRDVPLLLTRGSCKRVQAVELPLLNSFTIARAVEGSTSLNAMRTAGSDCKQIAGSDSGVWPPDALQRLHAACVEMQRTASPETPQL